MAGITVDIKKMKGTVKSGINKGVSNLNSAVSIISGAKVPKDFPAGAKAKGYSSQIQDVIKTLNSVSSWIDKVANKFEQAETKNKALIDNLIGSLSSSSNANAPSSGYAARSGQKSGKKTTFRGGLNSLFNEFNSGKTGAKVTTCKHIYESSSSYAAASGNRNNTNAKTTTLGEGWKAFKRSFGEEGSKELKRTGCDVANVSVGFLAGGAKFGENVVDAGVDIFGKVSKIVTVPRDKVSYYWNKAMGTTEKYKSWTDIVQKNTMSYVAVDHVGNFYSNFYKNTKVGQFLDNNAHSAFKSNGSITNFAKEAGKMAMPFLMSIATGGVVEPKVFAAISTYGNSVEKYYQNAESKSWKGVEKQYKAGEIDKNTYEKYSKVRNMSDKEWSNVTKEYKNGKMSKEEYQQLKNIRQMSEDWRNTNAEIKSTFYGAANSFWEYLQYGSVEKLAGKFGYSKLKSASLDIAFNAMDTPYKSAVDAISYGKSYKQAFNDRGGWKQVLMDSAIGLGNFALGEFHSLKKANKVKDTHIDCYINYDYSQWVDWSTNVDRFTRSNMGPYLKQYYLNNNDKLRAVGITDEQIEVALKNVEVLPLSRIRELWEMFTGKKSNTICALNHGGISYIPPDVSDGVAIHEIMHSLGNLYGDKFDKQLIAINEAFTDNITNNITKYVNNGAYAQNAKIINNITYCLEMKYGIKDLDFHTYFGNNKKLYKDWVDYVAGDGFWDELVKQMDIQQNNSLKREEAAQKLEMLFQFFVQEINLK